MAKPISLHGGRSMKPKAAAELKYLAARERMQPMASQISTNNLYRYMIQKIQTEGGKATWTPYWTLLTDSGQSIDACNWRAIGQPLDKMLDAVAECDNHFNNLVITNETFFLNAKDS